MKKSKPKQVIKIKRPTYIRLDDMNQEELRKELDGLPHRINLATAERDQLFAALRAQWSTAYANDAAFVTAYAQAEAAGSNVVYLLQRTIKASRLYNERYGGKLL